MSRVYDTSLGDIFSMQEFFDMAECGGITPWDGNGYPAKVIDGVMTEFTNYSCWGFPHEGFTHITWYNK